MRAVFLDRDGVICENRSDHVKNWQEFQFLPGAKASLAALSQLDLPIIVVTNQAIVGRGMVPAGVIDDIHRRMLAEVEAHGGRIDHIVYCPHRTQDRCGCRKPEPGMLLSTADRMGIDLSQSYMVGDAVTDLMAGQQVGCQTYLVLTGRGLQQLVPALHAVDHFTITRSLVGAAAQILEAELGGVPDVVNAWNPAFLRYARRPLTAALGV
jgi:D-glycero-D-manno-heptose 1,7-bisphosphate phosphatase